MSKKIKNLQRDWFVRYLFLKENKILENTSGEVHPLVRFLAWDLHFTRIAFPTGSCSSAHIDRKYKKSLNYHFPEKYWHTFEI